MADLDDFFAKKDKKKSKSKPKFLTADDLIKILEDSKKEAVNKQKKGDVPVNTNMPAVGVSSNESEINTKVPVESVAEEEWKDFEQEQRKDYTGLKIGQLTLNDDEDDDDYDEKPPTDGDDDEADSDGNINTDITIKGSENGPWKKLIPAEEVTQIPVEIEKPSKVYISPALRPNYGSGMRPTRNRAAPDITNAEFFPTLGAARPEEQRKKKNEPAFEEVRHGGRIQRIQEPTSAPTAATNRFEGLDEAAS